MSVCPRVLGTTPAGRSFVTFDILNVLLKFVDIIRFCLKYNENIRKITCCVSATVFVAERIICEVPADSEETVSNFKRYRLYISIMIDGKSVVNIRLNILPCFKVLGVFVASVFLFNIWGQ